MKSRTKEERGLQLALEQERITPEQYDTKMLLLQTSTGRVDQDETRTAPKSARTPTKYIRPAPTFFARRS